MLQHAMNDARFGNSVTHDGCLIAPFHNMMLVCPATTHEQVRRLVDAFAPITRALAA